MSAAFTPPNTPYVGPSSSKAKQNTTLYQLEDYWRNAISALPNPHTQEQERATIDAILPNFQYACNQGNVEGTAEFKRRKDLFLGSKKWERDMMQHHVRNKARTEEAAGVRPKTAGKR